VDLRLYGLAALEMVGHDRCDIAAFCRNPLHPGPCKGWKHTLKAMAPGVHKAVEDGRLERVHKRRAERAAAHKAAGTKAPRLRKLKHEREETKGPREGETGSRVKDSNGDEVLVTGTRGKAKAKPAAALAKWDASGGTGKGMTDDEVGEALIGAQQNADFGTAVLVVREYKKRLEASGGTKKRVRPGKPPAGKKDVGSTRTVSDGEGDTEMTETREVKPLKGPAQREGLRAVLNAGANGYDNKRGFLTKKQRDRMVAAGEADLGDDGKLYITDHGRAVHEASIPRRNGEEIGFDDKTASERAAAEEAAKGEEAKRVKAEAEAQFQRGIPGVQPRGSELLGNPGQQRVRDSMRKAAQSLSKDLGETTADFSEDVGPAARAWQDRSLEAEAIGSEWRQQRARSAWLRSAAKADPGRAADYERMADETDAGMDATDKRWDAAVDAANAARDALGEAIVGRYKAKGRRKTAAALKLATVGKDKDATNSGTDAQRATINAEIARRDGGLEQLAEGLTPEQAERGRKAGNAYTAAVVEDIKAGAEYDAARYEASVAHAHLAEAQRVPSMLRNEPKYKQEREDAQARATAADRRERAARDRADVTKEQKRRAAVNFQRTADDLTDEKNQAAYDERLARVTREQNERRAAHQRELDAEVDAVRRPMPDAAEPFAAQVDKVEQIARSVKGFREFLNQPPYVIHDGKGSGDMAIYTGSTNQEVIRGSAPEKERVLNYSPKRGGWKASNGLALDDADVPYYIAEWNARDRNTRNPNDLVGLAKYRRKQSEQAAAERAGADTMPA